MSDLEKRKERLKNRLEKIKSKLGTKEYEALKNKINNATLENIEELEKEIDELEKKENHQLDKNRWKK